MPRRDQSFSKVSGKISPPYLSHLTLRDLVEAVGDELHSEDDQLVAVIVSHLLDSGKVCLLVEAEELAA